MKNLTLIAFILIFCFSCTKKTPATPNKELAAFFEQYWQASDEFDAIGSTSRGVEKYNHILPNENSIDFRNKYKAFLESNLASINKFDRESLTDNDKISYDVFKRDIEISLEGYKFESHLMPIQQFWGTYLTMVQLGSGESDQPFKTVKDYDNFLGRLNDFTPWSDSAIVNMRAGIKIGAVLPKSLTQKVIPQLEGIVSKDVTKSIFYGPINKLPKSFSEADKQRLTTAYKNAIEKNVNQNYGKLANFFKTEYLPKTRLSSGYDAIPNGSKEYAYLVKQWTTTNMTPDEIHQLGLKEVARIRAEMEKIKTEVGFKGSLKEFFAYTQKDAQFKTFKTPQEVLAGFEKIHQTMEPQLKKSFNLVPKSKFEIRRTEAFREATASAEYLQGSPDGSRPGIFYVPILDAKTFVYPGMESLFLHEAIPGHHYQTSLQMENKDLPQFRRFYWAGAYGEGWALYCESLGKEMGLYTNPYQYFGALGDEMHRAIRLVVDTGIHSKQWSREKAIDYSLDNEPSSEQAAIAEIERYMAIPGQALSYKIGALKIRELRTKFEKQLGTKFNLAAFHDEILKDGCLPIAILESKMNTWASSIK
jgi:uncharacterized protein (DUF885 family)